MAAINPGLFPNVVHFPIEYRLIGINGAMYAVGFDQSFERLQGRLPIN
jgi:hypothetical protein